ncbi:hypothetical protein [Ekhidna sp.]|uniref:hypothetical protein n=1 Tax=Ekhidna sp. TaxID=2608089 RepID=UPI0032981088
MIKFADIKSIGLKEYSNYVRENLDQKLYFEFNEHHLVYHCLKLTNFRKLNDTKESVSNYARKVLYELLSPGLESLINSRDPLKIYVNIVLNLRVLPIIEKAKLELEIKKDLQIINDLLKDYEKEDFIKRLKKKDHRPRNHNERTIHDFYQRVLALRETILDYLVNGVEERAIINSESKSKYDDPKMDELMSSFKDHSDYPYRDLIINLTGGWSYRLDLEKLDWRKINPYRNKSNVFSFKSDISNPKARKFDRMLLKEVDGANRLRYLHQEIRNLPLQNRAKIFKELRTLYAKKLWHGFYALALPQVEGIFTEMIELSLPEVGQKSSLSDKVNAVRPLIEGSSYSFDYYEYYLPRQRNQFSHSGYDDNIRLKCNGLVLDLQDVIENFKELESPVVQISNMINEGLDRFKHIGNLSHFIYLFIKVKQLKKLSLIRDKADKFVYSTLIKNIDFEGFFKNLQVDFDIAIKDSKLYFSYVLRTYLGSEIDVYSISRDELHKNAKDIVNTIQEHQVLFLGTIKLLLDTQNFVLSFIRSFPKVEEEIIQLFNEFIKKNEDVLTRLQILNSQMVITVDEEFFLAKDWTHTHKMLR